MKYFFAAALIVSCLTSQLGPASAGTKASKVFFLEDAGNHQWCAFNNEARWKAAVQQTRAMTVGTLTYSHDHLYQIHLTETDESGDWTTYDHYFLDGHGHVVKLLRTINVLPGDRSVLQSFSIRGGKVTKMATTAKRLSTGETLTSPKPVWLPELPVETTVKKFAFSNLIGRADLQTARRICVDAGSIKAR